MGRASSAVYRWWLVLAAALLVRAVGLCGAAPRRCGWWGFVGFGGRGGRAVCGCMRHALRAPHYGDGDTFGEVARAWLEGGGMGGYRRGACHRDYCCGPRAGGKERGE